MTKDERTVLADRGLTILRPMFDQRRQCWEIAKYTKFGGWKRFGGAWYFSSDQAMSKIDAIIAFEPDIYAKED
jgi:hypothetical protein